MSAHKDLPLITKNERGLIAKGNMNKYILQRDLFVSNSPLREQKDVEYPGRVYTIKRSESSSLAYQK